MTTYGSCFFEKECQFPTESGGIYPGCFLSATEIVDSMEFAVDFLPRQVVPINDDGGGNNICLSARKDSCGHIYFRNHSIGWEHNTGDDDAAKTESMFLMASSFTEFVLALEIEG